MTMMKKAILCVTLATMLTACGVKPKNIEPPSGAKDDVYPATYPYPDESQVEYDRTMTRIYGQKIDAEKAAQAAAEDAKNKPDWSVR